MKRLLYIFYILIIIIILIPKEKMYFSLEKILGDYHLSLSNESIHNRFIYIDVDNAQVLLDKLPVATVENMQFLPWIVYNRFSISNIEALPQFKTFFPGKVENVALIYTIFHPLSLKIVANGDFGQCRGDTDLLNRHTRIVFESTPKLRQYPFLVFKLHQEKEGLVYESDF